MKIRVCIMLLCGLSAMAAESTQLFRAIRQSDAKALALLLRQGADPNVKNAEGATALMWAAGDSEKVKLLLRSGADIKAKSKLGRTSLIIAAASAGNLESVRLLLSKGADPSPADESGDGPVGSAASSGDVAILRTVLKAGGSAKERIRSNGVFRGFTPLMRAVLADCIECVRVLLEQGADVNAVSDAPRSIQAGNQSLGSLTPLLLAAPKSNLELIRMLLDHGASVDAREARGLTPLIRAATGKSQNPEVVRLLLSKGVKPGAQAADGATAASWAEKWGRNQPPDTAVVLATGHSARDAAAHAISLLQASNATYFKRTGCVGCHHQMLSAIAISAARDRGLSADENPASQLRAMLVATKRPLREELFERVSHGLSPIESSLFLIALASLQYSSDSLTDALCHDLAGFQHSDGFWEPLGHRPPMVYSRFSATAYAIWALELYGSPGRRK